MIYIFLSLILAMVFGLGAHSYYGTEDLMKQVWVEYVFWAILFVGALSALVASTRSLLCKILQIRKFSLCNTPSPDLSPKGTAY